MQGTGSRPGFATPACDKAVTSGRSCTFDRLRYKAFMPLHLVKLCVGAESVGDLEGWIAQRLAEQRRAGQAPEQRHTTRMVPQRKAELLDGGSMFWVIKGQITVRQTLLDIRPFTDADGISRCHLVLEPSLVEVEPRPRKAFQGWRYLSADDAPPDLGRGLPGIMALPEPLRRELRELGLI